MKASSAGRECSMAALKKRLGEFTPDLPQSGVKPSERVLQPVDPPSDLWDRYAEERSRHQRERTGQRQRVVEPQRAQWTHLADRHRRERADVVRGSWRGRGALLNATRSVLAARQAREKAELHMSTGANALTTILRWYRELVAKKYEGSARRGHGRPRTAAEIIRLLVEMARRNTGWGYTRLRGALKNVGYTVGRNTIKRILKEQGIEPAPLRRRKYSWATFIKAHLSAISAADFFTVEVLTWVGLVRYHVFFVMDLASRRVEIAGISRCPDGLWMEQVARNLLDEADGFLFGKRYLILHRDPLYTCEFRAAMKRGGVEVLRLPPASPNLNAYAERFAPLPFRTESPGPRQRAHRRRAGPREHERPDRETRASRRIAQLLPPSGVMSLDPEMAHDGVRRPTTVRRSCRARSSSAPAATAAPAAPAPSMKAP